MGSCRLAAVPRGKLFSSGSSSSRACGTRGGTSYERYPKPSTVIRDTVPCKPRTVALHVELGMSGGHPPQV